MLAALHCASSSRVCFGLCLAVKYPPQNCAFRCAHVLACSVRPQALREHLKQVGSKDVTLVEVPGAFHELLQGPEMPAVVEGINAWVLSHAAAKDVPALALA